MLSFEPEKFIEKEKKLPFFFLIRIGFYQIFADKVYGLEKNLFIIYIVSLRKKSNIQKRI